MKQYLSCEEYWAMGGGLPTAGVDGVAAGNCGLACGDDRVVAKEDSPIAGDGGTVTGGSENACPNETELTRWLVLASAVVDDICFHRIGRLERLTPYQQGLVKAATRAQADYLRRKDADVGLDAGQVTGFTVTDVSVRYGSGDGEAAWRAAQNHCPEALEYLKQTGLTFRGV